MSHEVQFSRTHMEDCGELRVQVPRRILAALDAECIKRGGESANVYRATIVTQVLGEWAEDEIHHATVLLRMVTDKPIGSESVAEQGARP